MGTKMHYFFRLVVAGIRVIRNEGWRSFFIKATYQLRLYKSFLAKRVHSPLPSSELQARVNHLRKLMHYDTQMPLPADKLRPVNPSRLKITWIIPDFAPGAGGHMTIFRIASCLERFGHEVSFLIQNPSQHATGEAALATINTHFQPFKGRVDVLGEELPQLQGDALIATDRFTCYIVRALSGFRGKFYLVQDYEPLFYPMGAEYLIAENTYSMGFDCLCAGDWLATMMRERYGLWSMSWPLAYDHSIYYVDENVPRSADRIAFYARFVTSRRAVELGMMAFDILYKRGMTFHVDFFGWDLRSLKVGYSYTNHGIASSRQLGDLYRRAAIGMVFSTSNHSLVDKEMMACGLPVIELDLENVKAIFPAGVMQLVKPEPDAIADGLQHLLASPERREELRRAVLDHIKGLSWETSARLVEKALIERLAVK
jgi:glycosyltransferase involved in cell wall biosynthesis